MNVAVNAPSPARPRNFSGPLAITHPREETHALILRLIADVPRGHAATLDQLRRAASSIPLNIAEGAGRTSVSDAARSYAIARGSAMECAAILDVCQQLGIVDEEGRARGIALLERVVAMLTKLCRA